MNLFELMAKISLDTKEFDSKLNGLAGKATKALGGAVKTTAKATTALVGAGAAGLTALTKQGVSAYAEYEQLEGGVETLFKNAKNTVVANAKEAYKTAGLSMNEYMETANGMAAALGQTISSNEGVAAYADKAIQDMSDNANKMGTSMESIQNAYNGFSKQNYTMLDNLKLGYGGTKSEAERLIKDAEKLNKNFRATRDANDNLTMSYADMVDAIHIVQDEMGITGTTADEAMKTISGSAGMAKAAWNNVVTSIASGDTKQLSKSIDNLVESIVGGPDGGGLLNNLKPAILNAIKGVGKLITQAAPIIADVLPQLMEEILPPLTNALVELMKTALPVLARMLPGLISTLLPALIESFVTLVGALIEEWPTIWAGLKDAMRVVIDTIEQAINERFPYLGTMIKEMIQGLADCAPLIISLVVAFKGLVIITKITKLIQGFIGVLKAIKNFSILGKIKSVATGIVGLTKTIGAFVVANGPVLLIIAAVAAAIVGIIALIKNWDAVVEFAKGVWEEFISFWGDAFAGLGQLISDIWNGICDTISGAWEGLQEWLVGYIEEFVNFWSEAWEGAKQLVSDVWNAISEFFSGIWTSISETASTIWNGVTGFFSETWSSIKETATGVWNEFSSWIGETWNGIKEKASETWTNIKEGIGEKWNSIKENTSTAWSNIKSGLSSAWSGITNGVRSFGSSFKSFWGDIMSGISGKTKDLISSALTWGKDLIDNFIGGIKSMMGKLGDAVKGVASKIKSFLGFSEPEEGPLSNFHTYAPDMIDLFTKGIYDNMNQVTKASSDLAAAIKPGMPDGLDTVSVGGTVSTAVAGGGDLIIPVYIGANKLDEILIKQEQLTNYRSGGR